MLESLDPGVLVFLALAGLAAGFIDAVVGGGGLIQLPALLVGLPGATPVQLLATNKVGSICGTTVSSITYVRRIRPDLRTALPLAAAAFVGSLGGAALAFLITKEAFNPIILVVLVVVGCYTLARPTMGQMQALRFGHSRRRHLGTAAVIGLAVGAYDGALGPGTGSFFVFALVSALGYGFLEASAKAKIANLATNLAALVVFVPQGAVIWPVGLLMGVGNILGGYLGARVAVARGSGFVRSVFVVLVVAFILKIGYDTWVQFLG
ncbi:TSUP family transporter [Ornithinimicrobium sp. LYQ92]|uniref:TSUP family transporter n=1 Tax=Serinicoccus sp. LYQ92 TaxID=3378798 RepID=UPI003852841A